MRNEQTINLKTALKDAMEESRASQKVLLIEQQKHIDTSNWAMEQQERADVAEAEKNALRTALGSKKEVLFNAVFELETENAELREICRDLLRVLPSSSYWEKLDNDESWEWCWNELSDQAQEHVQNTTIKANKALASKEKENRDEGK